MVRRPRRVQGKKALPVRKALLVGKVRLDPLVGWVPRARPVFREWKAGKARPVRSAPLVGWAKRVSVDRMVPRALRVQPVLRVQPGRPVGKVRRGRSRS